MKTAAVACVPQVHALEPRRLFANAHVMGEALMIRADQNATNTVVVTDSADAQSVDVAITSVTRRGVTKNFTASFPKSLGFIRVQVRGGMRDDLITFGTESDPFEMDVRANGFAGNDTITGGAANDHLAGGLGDDVIHAGTGNDTVHAGRGDDMIFGEAGDDILWGGFGNDEVDGGSGNDKLGGVLGTNKLTGGDGEDEFRVRSLEVNPENDYTEGVDILTIVRRKDRDECVTPAVA